MTSVKLAVAQFNPTVGDLQGNAEKLLQFARHAHAQGAEVMVAPELALCGYPPEDLLLRPAFLQACADALQQLAADLAPLDGLHVVLGHPLAAPGDFRERSVSLAPAFNACSVLHEGQIVCTYTKRELPNYQVFDERRYFRAGGEPQVFNVKGLCFGLNICEDAWFPLAPQLAQQSGAQVLLVLNASPFHRNKAYERERWMRNRCRETGMPLVFAHLVGGQDEVVFDGQSFVLDAQGEVAARAAAFADELLLVDFQGGVPHSGRLAPALSDEEQVYRALVTGVRDYVGKNGFPGAIIGLSGGIDSALTLAVAVDALGRERVHAVMMPSPYTAEISWLDSRDMAARLKVRYSEIPIAPMMQAFGTALAPVFQAGALHGGLPHPHPPLQEGREVEDSPPRVGGLNETPPPAGGGGGEGVNLAQHASHKHAAALQDAPRANISAADTTFENIQARIRGTLLMALSNRSGSIVLTTGNKSELATGYCTLYGDMAGGFAVIKDLAKTLVYRLSRWRNAHDPYAGGAAPIPDRIITRPPSAELRPNQTDQDSLPDYEVLDGIMQRYMEEDESIEQIVAAGYSPADVERVTRLLKINEYKRRQAPVGIRITHRAFGRDWRYPITSKFRA